MQVGKPAAAGVLGDAVRDWSRASTRLVERMYFRLLLMDEPAFLSVLVGDAVLVESPGTDWWVGHVIHREGGARCSANNFFQIACVDTGVVRTVNANCVTAIVERPVEVPVRV
jgi:hypothetical protein